MNADALCAPSGKEGLGKKGAPVISSVVCCWPEESEEDGKEGDFGILSFSDFHDDRTTFH